ncbi:carcinoembryonic antigen-related cell adhesion molecule 6-like, partial [Pteropus alecto]|uniref:carcinoembryonic antigen-related cell adhesion molecule 6-like n=1 Tax=Pteropus alecto TaxID=9402 RepID=UPI0007687C2A
MDPNIDQLLSSLLVSLLTSWNPPAIAQLTLESLPSNAAEGKDVLLLVHNLPVDLAAYAWYKGASVDRDRLIASYAIDGQENNPGPGYSGRETIYPNGSLLIQNVTLKDTGYYTLQIIKKNLLNEEVTGQFCVYVELPTSSVASNNSNYKSFHLHAPSDSDVEHLLMGLWTICISALEECLFEGLPVFSS